ncbi:general substrate transporter [Aspergillus avenaceus]|uniref:General substrate transporter n=1 Tax=Aspergillus avenaceus TaxID=36643 RepID=A0A5N6TXF8_ASPAV|nr:general substrate transporter [Aspergillus avenaceus]
MKHLYVWLFCSFATLGACLYGYIGVYFTGISAMDAFIQHFGEKQTNGTYAISPSSLSLMTSVINIGELVGALTASPLNDLTGRKGVFLIASIIVVIGVILQLVTDHKLSMIIAGRIFLGYGVGNFSATSPLYIGEIAPTRLRGPLLMCWQLVLSVTQIVAAAINRGTQGVDSTVAFRVPIAAQLIFPLILLTFLWWVPESPRWLLRKNKVEAARRALQDIHRDNNSYVADGDLSALKCDIDNERKLSQGTSWLDLILDPIERRKTIYSAGALIAQQVNGIQWFYYFGTVFSKTIGLSDPFLMTLIVFIIQAVVVLCAIFCANKLPRRPLLLITTGIMGVSIFVVGCLGIPSGEVSPTSGKVIISFVIIEIIAFNFAWGPLGWTIASEMAVGRNRDKIYAVAVACFWVTIWATVFTLPYMYYSAELGPKTGFVYTGLCVASFAYVHFCVGEVTDRSIEEINWFFMHSIPARKWRDQPRPATGGLAFQNIEASCT